MPLSLRAALTALAEARAHLAAAAAVAALAADRRAARAVRSAPLSARPPLPPPPDPAVPAAAAACVRAGLAEVDAALPASHGAVRRVVFRAGDAGTAPTEATEPAAFALIARTRRKSSGFSRLFFRPYVVYGGSARGAVCLPPAEMHASFVLRDDLSAFGPRDRLRRIREQRELLFFPDEIEWIAAQSASHLSLNHSSRMFAWAVGMLGLSSVPAFLGGLLRQTFVLTELPLVVLVIAYVFLSDRFFRASAERAAAVVGSTLPGQRALEAEAELACALRRDSWLLKLTTTRKGTVILSAPPFRGRRLKILQAIESRASAPSSSEAGADAKGHAAKRRETDVRGDQARAGVAQTPAAAVK